MATNENNNVTAEEQARAREAQERLSAEIAQARGENIPSLVLDAEDAGEAAPAQATQPQPQTQPTTATVIEKATIIEQTDAPQAPTLSLDTFSSTQLAKDEVPSALEDSLTGEELAAAESFSKQIDIRNYQQVATFGSQPQRKMSTFSGDMLSTIRTRNLDVAGDALTSVIGELKSLDLTEEKKKGILGFFRKQKNKLAEIKSQYDSVEKNVNKIAKELEKHQFSLIRDSEMLSNLYDLNLSYFKELTMYIVAGKKAAKELRDTELRELVERAKETGSAEDAEAAQNLGAQLDRFEKKLSDLDLTRTVSMQMAPQIRLVQSNERLMIEKIDTTLKNTIPLWKNQMVLAVGLENSEKALRAEKAVTDMTNKLLKENSERLRRSTVEIARESERGIIDIETLRTTNNNLIDTFDEMLEVQAQGRADRAAAEIEMRRMEGELKKKLIEVSARQLDAYDAEKGAA